MEAFRAYLATFPRLADRLLERLADAMGEGLFDYNNAEEMRLAYKEAQQLAVEHLEESKTPYYAIVYPQAVSRCPVCNEDVQGAYWEISNPVTRERGMFRLRLVHALLAHGEPEYSEPILNMSETQMGFDDHAWDAKKILKILDGLPAPPAALQELQALAAIQEKNKKVWT